MGMDVFGRAPQDKTGGYFRRSMWGWRPLADYILNTHPQLAENCEYWHSNDGDGLDATDSMALAAALQRDIDDGAAARYIEERNRRLAALPQEMCEICGGTGERHDVIVQGQCNGCGGTGKCEPWETHYGLDLDDIKEFARFLQTCGGFEID